MTPFVSPAASALWEQISAGARWNFGPLSLTRLAVGIDLRHFQDADTDTSALRSLGLGELRTITQADALGRFRPNKAAPNLVRGWHHVVPDARALDDALEALLPGGLADWHAAATGVAIVVPWQQYADRQTGMYRNVGSLTEPDGEAVAQAGCHPRCCTRRRLWTVGDRPPEGPELKSLVPCLEPCALVLELARRAQKSSVSEERCSVPLTVGDLALLDTLFDRALDHPDPALREGDLSSPGNPRRILLLREKLLPWLPSKTLRQDP